MRSARLLAGMVDARKNRFRGRGAWVRAPCAKFGIRCFRLSAKFGGMLYRSKRGEMHRTL